MKPIASPSYRALFALGLASLYHWFFWQEKLGLNLVLFSSLLIGISWGLYPAARKSRPIQILAFGALLTAALVLVHNSFLSKFAHISTMWALIGWIQLPQLRSLGFVLQSSMAAHFSIGGRIRNLLPGGIDQSKTFQQFNRRLDLVWIPLAALGGFAYLYYHGNHAFAQVVNEVGLVIRQAFREISLASVLFFLGGCWLIAAWVVPHFRSNILKREQTLSDQLIRARNKNFRKNPRMLALKRAYQSGVLMIVMVNALLLLNNLLDIQYVWVQPELQAAGVLSESVHKGVNILIASILLSMGIMIYFFRGNLNFYSKNRPLRFLCYGWIVQNGFLLLSVGMRDFHYVSQYGLTYKRIGVFFFLLLTLFGLCSLAIKIRDRKSGFYLWRVNAWALWGGMVLFSLINWDIQIAQHNFAHHDTGKPLDLSILLTLSDKTLPLVLARSELIENTDRLRSKQLQFLEAQSTYSWLSWNLAAHRTKAYLETQPLVRR